MENKTKEKVLVLSPKAIEEASVVRGPSCIGCNVKSKKERILKEYNSHIA